jgi:hypothetical protein
LIPPVCNPPLKNIGEIGSRLGAGPDRPIWKWTLAETDC